MKWFFRNLAAWLLMIMVAPVFTIMDIISAMPGLFNSDYLIAWPWEVIDGSNNDKKE